MFARDILGRELGAELPWKCEKFLAQLKGRACNWPTCISCSVDDWPDFVSTEQCDRFLTKSSPFLQRGCCICLLERELTFSGTSQKVRLFSTLFLTLVLHRPPAMTSVCIRAFSSLC